MINIVIPMAGQSSRFKKEGINTPKHEIIANGKYLFDWSLLTFKPLFHTAHFTFICHNSNIEFIKERLKELGINQYSILSLTKPTSGQAETVLIGLKKQNIKSRVLIFNIDTHIKPQSNSFDFLKEDYDGWLQLFEAEGSHWSFAKIDNDNIVTEVKEKIKISNYASTGMYYFKSSEQFIQIFNKYKDEVIRDYKEYYVAPMYQYLLNENATISSSLVNSSSVIPLGTPKEVNDFDKNFKY